MSDPAGMRASDAERELTADALREHFAAGRLDTDELAQRIDAVYAARTVKELAAALSDLPDLPPSQVAVRSELATRQAELRRRLLQQAGGSFGPFVVCVVIWAGSGGDGSFWPVFALIMPLLFLVRNMWRLHGPAPQLDRVERELRRGRGRGRRRHRRELGRGEEER